MAIFNCTPHVINIYKQDDVDMSNPRRLFVKPDAQPHVMLQPCGTILNATIDRVVMSDKTHGLDVPLVTSKFVGVQYPPTTVQDSTDDDWFIVSALFKSAFNAVYPGHAINLLTVDSVVYDDVDNPRPCGCLNLSI